MTPTGPYARLVPPVTATGTTRTVRWLRSTRIAGITRISRITRNRTIVSKEQHP